MAKIYALTSFKHGKQAFVEGQAYDVPDDAVGYFKMAGWARYHQDGDPAAYDVVTEDKLNPHAPADDIVLDVHNGVLGVADPGQE